MHSSEKYVHSFGQVHRHATCIANGWKCEKREFHAFGCDTCSPADGVVERCVTCATIWQTTATRKIKRNKLWWIACIVLNTYLLFIFIIIIISGSAGLWLWLHIWWINFYVFIYLFLSRARHHHIHIWWIPINKSRTEYVMCLADPVRRSSYFSRIADLHPTQNAHISYLHPERGIFIHCSAVNVIDGARMRWSCAVFILYFSKLKNGIFVWRSAADEDAMEFPHICKTRFIIVGYHQEKKRRKNFNWKIFFIRRCCIALRWRWWWCCRELEDRRYTDWMELKWWSFIKYYKWESMYHLMVREEDEKICSAI